MIITNLQKIFATFVTVGLLGCGGGGGSSGNGGANTATNFNTTEFQANFGLATIGALTAYDNSGTGEGITVAVVDTGIDVNNSEFTGAISPASIDIITNSSATLQDEVGHGTGVSGVIAAGKNDALTHGVAFDATILAIRAEIAGGFFLDSSLASAINYAVANNADIINLSLGGNIQPSAAWQTALQNAVNAGVIVVSAAGNEGGDAATQVQFAARLANCSTTIICDALTAIDGFNAQGRMIAVGSTDQNNSLSSFSNPAGDTASAYLVAPGRDIVTTAVGGGTTTVSGTSFAAPHVSAALAIVLERFPTLSAAQAVDLLLATATDLGANGTDTIFGRGLLNLQAAFQAQGILGISTDNRVTGPRVDLRKTFLTLGPAFGSAFSTQNFLESAIILDAYDRPYRVDLRNRIISSSPDPRVALFFEDNSTQLISVAMPSGLSLNFDIANDEPPGPAVAVSAFTRSNGPKSRLQNDIRALRFSAALGNESEVSAAHEASALTFFGNTITDDASGGIFFNSNWISAPQLTLLGKGDSLRLSHSFSKDTELNFGIHQSSGFSSSSTSGAGHLAQAQLFHKGSNGFRYGLTTGFVSEENALFSSSSSGAFGTINDNQSLHTSLSASWNINDKANIFATYTDATVKPSFSGHSLLNNWSRIYANAFAFGVTTHSQFRDGDRVGISLGQPLRVRKSNADITLPVGRDMSGNVLQETQRVDLVPTGREINLQLAYTLNDGSQSELASFATLTWQPGHNHSADADSAIGFKWKREF